LCLPSRKHSHRQHRLSTNRTHNSLNLLIGF
jgi:hypothetical protein